MTGIDADLQKLINGDQDLEVLLYGGKIVFDIERMLHIKQLFNVSFSQQDIEIKKFASTALKIKLKVKSDDGIVNTIEIRLWLHDLIPVGNLELVDSEAGIKDKKANLSPTEIVKLRVLWILYKYITLFSKADYARGHTHHKNHCATVWISHPRGRLDTQPGIF